MHVTVQRLQARLAWAGEVINATGGVVGCGCDYRLRVRVQAAGAGVNGHQLQVMLGCFVRKISGRRAARTLYVSLVFGAARGCNGNLWGGIATADIVALRQLYDVLQGHFWVYPATEQPWNFTDSITDYCQWFGVYCCPPAEEGVQAVKIIDKGFALLCDTPGAVVALELQNMNLHGRLPPWNAIGALASLALMNVSYNHGVLP